MSSCTGPRSSCQNKRCHWASPTIPSKSAADQADANRQLRANAAEAAARIHGIPRPKANVLINVGAMGSDGGPTEGKMIREDLPEEKKQLCQAGRSEEEAENELLEQGDPLTLPRDALKELKKKSKAGRPRSAGSAAKRRRKGEEGDWTSD